MLGASTLSTHDLAIKNVKCHENSMSKYLTCVLSDDSVVSSSAVWSQKEGILRVQFLKNVPADTRVSFRFVLQNAARAQKAVFPRVTLSTDSHVMGPHTSYFSLLSSSAFPQIEAGGLALESSDIHASLNEIVILFSCNFVLPKDSVVVVSGLMGSATPDTECLSIVTNVGEDFTAKWTQLTGTVFFSISKTVMSSTALRFAFTLRNPSSSQTPRTVEISVP